jgi:hypothetical protein
MKSVLFFTLIISAAFTSCSTVKDTAAQQAKGNLSVGFDTQKVDNGYEVNGHASTNVFGVEPYAAFKAGIRYNASPVQ